MLHHIKHHAGNIKHHIKKHKHIYIPSILTSTIAITAMFSLLLMNTASALEITGQNAVDVIGQRDGVNNILPYYTSNGVNNSPNTRGFEYPYDIALDSVDHRLFIADSNNNRVLVYNLDASNELLDNNPDYVLGQTNFKTKTQGSCTGSTYLNSPSSLAYDSVRKHLYVGSGSLSFNKIAIFDVATITNGESFVNHLGSNCSSGVTSQSTLYGVQQMVFNDDFSKLFVAEQWNYRILVFNTGDGVVNGENAINVLGQPDFTTRVTTSCLANSVRPRGLAYYHRVGAPDLLFASEYYNDRIMVFEVDTISNGEDAVNVLGQDALTPCVTQPTPTQSSFGSPAGMAISGDSLYTTDVYGHRIMEFNLADGITNNENAINLVGQTLWTSSTSATSQSGFSQPVSIAVNPSNSKLYVTDNANHRILTFDSTELSKASTEAKLASNVLGQTADGTSITYTKNGKNDSPNSDGFYAPIKTLLDANDHRLFVADSTNSRVLVFNLDTNNNPLDYYADFVLGQSDFRTYTSNLTQDGLTSPYGLAYDPTRKYLFVSDSGGANRIMVFDVNTITNGELAINVLGQPDFTSTGTTELYGPTGLTYDTTRNLLFVANGIKDRVEIYDMNVITNGESSTNYIGTTFNINPPTQQSLNSPNDVAYDPEDKKLYVADGSNNRILRFDVTTLTDSPNAEAVLAQTDFVTNTSGVTQSKMNSPVGLIFDTDRNYLYASDQWNNRVLVFDLNTLTNGEPATNVIGQTDWSAKTSATAQNRLNAARGLDFDPISKKLYITEASNQRITIFPTSNPTITAAANPVNGSTSGGGNTTITGTDFSVGATVKIDSTECTSTTRVSSTELTCIGIPAHSAGTVGVTVTNSDGATATRASSYTYIAQPTISSISPTSGTTSGGTFLTIYGSNFTAASTVKIGTEDCTSVSYYNSSRLYCTSTPANTAGTYDVTVTTLGGTSTTHANTKFTYFTPVPSISNVDPDSSYPGATNVDIYMSGTYLDLVTAVSIGADECNITAQASSSLECTITEVTNTAGYYNVVASSPAGQATGGVGIYYIYGQPTVTGILPTSGYSMGGDIIEISGTGFGSESTVTIGGISSMTYDYDTDYIITAVPPGTADTTVDVIVTNPGNQTDSAPHQQYTYTTPPGEWSNTIFDGYPNPENYIQSDQYSFQASDGDFITVWNRENKSTGDKDVAIAKIAASDGSFIWSNDGSGLGGKKITDSANDGWYYSVEENNILTPAVSDGNGGAYVLYHESLGDTGNLVLDHINSSGVSTYVSPVVLTNNAANIYVSSAALADDGTGNLYVSYNLFDNFAEQNYVGLQHLDATDGSTLTGFTNVNMTGVGSPRLVVDSVSHDAYLSYLDNYILTVKKINSATGGTTWTSTMPQETFEYIYSGSAYDVVQDSSNNLIVVYHSYDNGVKKLSSQKLVTATPAWEWYTSGVGGKAMTSSNKSFDYLQIITDGQDGAFAMWLESELGSEIVTFQRIDSTGTIQFGANGLTPTANIDFADSISNRRSLVSDGSTGAIFSFERQPGGIEDGGGGGIDGPLPPLGMINNPFNFLSAHAQFGGPQTTNMQKIDETGAIQWPIGAPDDDGYTFPTVANDNNLYPVLASDMNGGAAMFWTGTTSDWMLETSFKDLFGQYIKDGMNLVIGEISPSYAEPGATVTVHLNGSVEEGEITAVYEDNTLVTEYAVNAEEGTITFVAATNVDNNTEVIIATLSQGSIERTNTCPASASNTEYVTFDATNNLNTISSFSAEKFIQVKAGAVNPRIDFTKVSYTSGANKVSDIPRIDFATPEIRLNLGQCTQITTVNGATTWDQTFKAPLAKSGSTLTQNQLNTLGVSASDIASVITIGDPDHDMTISNADGYVEVQLYNYAGKKLAYIDHNGVVKKITKACGASIATSVQEDFDDPSGTGGMCVMDGEGRYDTDLFLYTRHFTDFIAYTEAVAPTVTAILPVQGSENGGTHVTIEGTNFGTGAIASIDGVDATSTYVLNDTTILAVTGAHTPAASLDVVVTNPNLLFGTLTGGYEYTAGADATSPPTITSINPTEGDATGGTTVAVTGTGFTDPVSVYFGSSPAPAITYTDATHLNGTTPSHATGSVDLIVINPNGWWGMSTDAYTYTSEGGGGGGCEGSSTEPGEQCGRLELSCALESPYFTNIPADTEFYEDGISIGLITSVLDQYAFTDQTGLALSNTDNVVAVKDVRDPSNPSCGNDGLTVNVTVQEMETPGDEDGLYFEPNPTTNSPSDPSIPLTGLYVLSSGDSCTTDFTEKGTNGICFKTLTNEVARCGNGDNQPTSICDGSEGATNTNYDGSADSPSYQYALFDTFTGLTSNILGSAANTPASVTLLEFNDTTELFGEASLSTAFAVEVPSGQPTNTYITNILYTVLPN